jgi:hypothetical protein
LTWKVKDCRISDRSVLAELARREGLAQQPKNPPT